MSYSYGIVHKSWRRIIIVNGGPDDHVDVVVHIKPKPFSEGLCSAEIIDYYDGIAIELCDADDHGPPYTTHRMIFTVNNGSVNTASYLCFSETQPSAFTMARFVMLCEFCRSDYPKAIDGAVKTRKLGGENELDEEISAICLEEYHVEDTIGTLRCNHGYHDKCIKIWLTKEQGVGCPICRTDPLLFCF